MKNREKLLNMAIYDLLKKIDSYVNDPPRSCVSDSFCIQEVFDSRFTVTNEIGCTEHVCPYEDNNQDCQACLNKWLNEEVYNNE